MKCPKCFKPVASDQNAGSLITCPHCTVQFLVSAPERAPASFTLHSNRSLSNTEPGEPKPRKRLMAAMLALGVGIIIFTVLRSPAKAIPYIDLVPSIANNGGVSCLGKHRCVLVYVTPWCPACSATVPAIEKIRERWAHSPVYGLSVIIGNDESEKIEATAAKIGEGTFVDKDDSVHGKFQIQGVPHWLVIDKDRKILKSFSGGSGDADVMLQHLGFND